MSVTLDLNSPEDQKRADELLGVRVKIIRLLEDDIWEDERLHIEGETGTVFANPWGSRDCICLRMDREALIGERVRYDSFPDEGLHLTHVELERLDDPDGNY